MCRHYLLLLSFLGLAIPFLDAGADEKAPDKITSGKVIVPEKMKRVWGELVSLDPKTRTGKFRDESNDEVVAFTALPYAELHHHGAFAYLNDFRTGERLYFRLHEDADGKWTQLTAIEDEPSFLRDHQEYYHVDKLDPDKGTIEVTQADARRSGVRARGLVIQTDKDTRFWKNGEPAKFADIKLNDKLRAKTHGTGKGHDRVAWEVFLDDASLDKWQKEQQAVHHKRMTEEGMPGYLDERDGKRLRVTLFPEAAEAGGPLKKGLKVNVSAASAGRRPTGQSVSATVNDVKEIGTLREVTLTCSSEPGDGLTPAAVVRVWIVP
jgi:hypothetical protein